MTPNVEPLRPSKQDGSTRVFCATCGHSEFVHEGDRGCRYSVCDCNRFVVGAEARLDPLGKVRPPSLASAPAPRRVGEPISYRCPTLRPSFLGPSTW
jgi:hypothetical protein